MRGLEDDHEGVVAVGCLCLQSIREKRGTGDRGVKRKGVGVIGEDRD